MYPDVVILGAGAAGLAAAKVLSAAGKRVVIIEARKRIGGRIHTLTDRGLKLPIELGAEFIHGRPKATWDLVHEAGLTAFDPPFSHKRWHAGRLVDLPDIETELGKVMRGLTHLGRRDKSFADYLRGQRAQGATPEARQFAMHFVQGFDAADPERISAKSLAEEQQGIGDLEDQTQFRLLHGYGELIEYLRGCLDPKRVQIRLDYPATEIRWEKSRVEIRSGAAREVIRARQAIITLPLGVLQIPPESPGSIRFLPEIEHWRASALGLASGSVVKCVLRFREPFWERSESLRDAAFIHHPDAPFPTWWTMRPLRVPLLTAWAGGPKAVALAGMNRQRLLSIAIECLSDLVSVPRRRLAQLVTQFHFHDWGSDPFSRGAYSYVVAGGMPARGQMSKPIEKTLHFAGEAIDTSGQASTVGGALASGQRAARLLANV
jgi:monoamine oxidase